MLRDNQGSLKIIVSYVGIGIANKLLQLTHKLLRLHLNHTFFIILKIHSKKSQNSVVKKGLVLSFTLYLFESSNLSHFNNLIRRHTDSLIHIFRLSVRQTSDNSFNISIKFIVDIQWFDLVFSIIRIRHNVFVKLLFFTSL